LLNIRIRFRICLFSPLAMQPVPNWNWNKEKLWRFPASFGTVLSGSQADNADRLRQQRRT
jgi:hypothetical protein